ncbi:hypothetical protein QEE_1726 [Clostridioides difficile CD113]|nr:hypothetical protein QEE_1726 [Clostridioides difficile CD113]
MQVPVFLHHGEYPALFWCCQECHRTGQFLFLRIFFSCIGIIATTCSYSNNFDIFEFGRNHCFTLLLVVRCNHRYNITRFEFSG